MNYKFSNEILIKIKKADKILINCHRGPDPDSVGSALALYAVLTKMGKEVNVICSDAIPVDCKFLPFSEKVVKENFYQFKFSDYDLFVLLDSGSWEMASGKKEIPLPKIPMITIDHHATNDGYGNNNYVDNKKSSTAEMLYLIFEDWKIKIDKDIAQLLLTGIIADTGVFEYPGVTPQTLEIAQKLMEKGADKDLAVLNIFRSVPFDQMKFWGEILRRMEIDEEYNFVWAAIPYTLYEEFGKPLGAKDSAASYFAPIVASTDFGMVMVETEEKLLSVSFRSRTGYDVSKLAQKFGGGGHITAAGARIKDLNFDEAVIKVLETVRKNK
jgi:bifunctional oligoribonuclease and PAP phosphatase NrnA